MTITTLSSRELNQDVTRAKKATKDGPVFITDRGRPAHVLLSIEEYQRLAGNKRNLVDALSMPGLADIDVEFPRSRALPRAADVE
ncbi:MULTISPECIES: type II toxin-antitoxin system Phd/YefM family antitoxin [Caballeronia]|uniref:type II toxin-antitoxin system Phd/YefM family antitoxin n=1 Tax=Caballeronia TaxID=1827195 RepID=UPI00045EF7C7|nr:MULTISPECIES: type II toxin-antitoxin system prevent-host-death family antitoxin [unclassified Caballeronia]MCE4541043.1 type II toxin-antitoxin system Phd/YefM family antitoxin [Caballeronia sp. PC1]MCE4569913.1 type II toxin-antitoxin system Phd/YefM family antitoxin [Caballeronia sp. CLC5]BAO87064.1 prevent-host-death family protein [Burkholderia sp. RPE67]BBP96951.1 antitoxin [Burkholderia sp. SFA1]